MWEKAEKRHRDVQIPREIRKQNKAKRDLQKLLGMTGNIFHETEESTFLYTESFSQLS